MKIRPAREKDAGAIASVHVDSWRSTYRDIIAPDYLASLSVDYHSERWLEILRRQNAKNCVFVAEKKDKQIIGFASGGPQRDPQLNYDGELYAIYVLETAQRHGLGTRLTHAVGDYLVTNGFENMLVWVLEDNPFRLFYEALGGEYVSKKTITIDEQELIEVAYGWRNLPELSKINAQ
ncbi:MAG: GNAT family N-acetyltransferase [Anaerolineales bacterium]|jgi:L-amino acid N-acyltransferase YncA